MGRKAHPYRVKEQDGAWYYKLRGEKFFHSTGIKVGNPKTSRRKAEKFCENLLAIAPDARKYRNFGDYAERYFKDESCPWWVKGKNRGKTLKLYTRKQHRARLEIHIIPQFGNHQFNELSPVPIENWIYRLDYSEHWKKHIFNTLRIILRDLRRDNLINFSPDDIDPPIPEKTERPTLPDEIAEILFPMAIEEFRELWGPSFPMGVFLALLYSSGLRTSEARALPWAAVDWENNGLMVVRTIDKDGNLSIPKGKSLRVVPLPEYTMELLGSLKRKTDLIFPSKLKTGGPLEVSSPNHALKRKFEELELNCKVTPHGLRHTYNTRMREILSTAGMEDYFSEEYGFLSTTAEVDKLLRSFTGHKTEAMTELYDHQKLHNRLKFLNDNFREYVEKIWRRRGLNPRSSPSRAMV
jgi:integrase